MSSPERVRGSAYAAQPFQEQGYGTVERTSLNSGYRSEAFNVESGDAVEHNGRTWRVCGHSVEPSQIMTYFLIALVVAGTTATVFLVYNKFHVSKEQLDHAAAICATVKDIGAPYLQWTTNSTIQGMLTQAKTIKQTLCAVPHPAMNLSQISAALSTLDTLRLNIANQTTQLITGSFAQSFSNSGWTNATCVDALLYHTMVDNDQWFGIENFLLLAIQGSSDFVQRCAVLSSTVFACLRKEDLEPYALYALGELIGYDCGYPYQIDGYIKTTIDVYKQIK